MNLPVVLQTLGLVGVSVGVLLLWGFAVAVLVGSGCVLAAGVVLEVERLKKARG